MSFLACMSEFYISAEPLPVDLLTRPVRPSYMTPLHIASARGHSLVVTSLLGYGADPEVGLSSICLFTQWDSVRTLLTSSSQFRWRIRCIAPPTTRLMTPPHGPPLWSYVALNLMYVGLKDIEVEANFAIFIKVLSGHWRNSLQKWNNLAVC